MEVGQHGKKKYFKKMKILIVGYGSIGKRHAKNILENPDMDVIFLSKRQKLNYNDFNKNEIKRIEISDSLENCLKEKIYAAIITNETSFHIKMATIIAKNNIDLFIEKPLSNSSVGLNNLEKIIKTKKLISMVGCNFRFFPPINQIKKLLDKKILGKIYHFNIENGSYLPDWHPNENYSNGYAARKLLGGGVTLTQIHEIDYSYWFFGKPTKIFSLNKKISNLKIDSDDIASSILYYKNKKIVGEIHLDFFQRPYYKKCKIKGEKGILEWESEKNQIRIYLKNQKKWNIYKIKNSYKLSSKKINQMYQNEIEYFLKCVKQRQNPMNSITEAKKILDIALAMKKSETKEKIILV